MPPRIAPGRGGPRGGGNAPRGGRGGGGAGRGGTHGLPSIAAHITTVGVRRPDYGSAGRPIAIHVNSFIVSTPESMIYHYDVIDPSTLPARFNMELVKVLQCQVAPQIFTPRVVYDGRKNIFASTRLDLGNSDSGEFFVSLQPAGGANTRSDRPPKVYKIKLTLVNQINPEVLQRFVKGQQSHDNDVLTAIMALNVVIRMDPNQKYPFNVRSFFTDQEKRDIGGGIELWRGYFQSVRPAIGRMLINVDISTGMMYKPGRLISLCLEFLGRPLNSNPNLLSPASGFPDRERLRLQKFLSGLRITTDTTGTKKRVIKKLTTAGANAITFTMHGGPTLTVANYFQQHANRPLQFPGVICVEVGSGALLPLEICAVPPGQLMKKQVPPEKTKAIVEFATKKPMERLASIRAGIDVLQYGQSDYIRQFGMAVETAAGPLPVQARVMQPPTLKYGQGSKQPSIVPRDGAWNMIDKRLYKPVEIKHWVIVVYESSRRFSQEAAQEMVKGFIEGCKSVGITVRDINPLIKYENAQGNISEQLKAAGLECRNRTGSPPELITVILPENGDAIYTAVKHFGDIQMGVATQCLKSNKCFRAKLQYWANVSLKLNVKLGGINVIPDPSVAGILTDPAKPTIVMGADVMHPPPGADDRPSFTAVVGNVDSNNAKYIATNKVQTGRQEIIDDLKEMCQYILRMYMSYRQNVEKRPNSAPVRLIFYRDGVSEGQFQHVLDRELPLIKQACEALKIKPKITLVIVGKRHHVRLFPQGPQNADRSGNCPAGTIVDKEIAHPTEFDFFLQSHGGLLGTSRPAHYSVLYDENQFNSDSMQALTFALCHVYARSTRSVSIPAPVYYADIVCARAKNHYDPRGDLGLSDTATQTSAAAGDRSDALKRGFQPLNQKQQLLMYFS